MIVISKTLKLQHLQKKDQVTLLQLMKKIYPPVYKHLWLNENCNWYLDSQYSKIPFERDLEASNADYYFLINKEKPIGIFRVIWDSSFEKNNPDKTLKIHRLYIDPNFHGKGFGKSTLKWLIEKAAQKKYYKLWLEVMDSQDQALKFYEQMGFRKKFAMRLSFIRIHEPLRGMFTMELNLNAGKKRQENEASH